MTRTCKLWVTLVSCAHRRMGDNELLPGILGRRIGCEELPSSLCSSAAVSLRDGDTCPLSSSAPPVWAWSSCTGSPHQHQHHPAPPHSSSPSLPRNCYSSKVPIFSYQFSALGKVEAQILSFDPIHIKH